MAESRSTNEAASLSLSDFDENKLKRTTALRRIQSDVKEEKSIGSLDHHKCSKEGINVVEADIVSVSVMNLILRATPGGSWNSIGIKFLCFFCINAAQFHPFSLQSLEYIVGACFYI